MPWSRNDLTRLVELEAQQQGVDPRLAVALAEQESGLDPAARSPKGATGIMQLMPGTAKQLKVNIDDPADNIRGGVTYLKQQLEAFGGDQARALAAYNAGPGVVKAYGKVPPYKETQGYVSRILGKLGPSSAEASTAAPARSRLEELEAELARRDAQTSPAAPGSPQEPSAMPDDATHAAETMARLRGSQAGAMGLQPPPAEMSALAVGGGPSQQAQPVTDPAALLAGGRGTARPWREGDPLPPGEKRLGVPDEAPVEETLSHPSVWGPMIAGVAGGVGGAALGRGAAALLGRGATTLPIVGEALGSLGARKADVALGIEQPGTVGDVLSAVVPLAGRAIGAIAPAIVRRLPGSAGAQHEMMAERIRAQPAAQAPATPAATLYRAVTQQGNPAIPAQQLRQTAQDLLTAEMRHGASLRNPTIVGVTRDIDALAAQYPQGIPMDRLYETMQRVGEMVGAAKRTGGTETRALNRLYAGFHEAIENAAQTNIPGAETLRQAIAASRQEHAVRRLGRIVGQGRGIEEQTATGYTFVKGKKMLNEFDRLVADDDVFRGSFTPEQIQEMRGLFQEASRLPALPTPSGTPRGSGAAATRAALGSIFGGPVGAAIAVSGHEIIAQAMMTAPGRAMLRAALEGRGGLTPQALAVLNTALREQLPAEKP